MGSEVGKRVLLCGQNKPNVRFRPIADISGIDDDACMSDGVQWLMEWYLAQCDGDWEHSYGVEIGTLDNPGWTLKVDLRDTGVAHRPFPEVMHGEPASDLSEWKRAGSWWVAEVRDGAFAASCGPLDLQRVITIFREWADNPA